MPISFRDVILKEQEQAAKKQDKRPEFLATITDRFGNATGSGDIWKDRNKRLVYVRDGNSTSPIPTLCYRITPDIGLLVWVGWTETGKREVKRSYYELLYQSNTTGKSYESPIGYQDLLPGGAHQLWLQSKMLEPLATWPNDAGLVLNVNAGYYLYEGARTLFAGSLVDISGDQPAGPNEHCLVGLYLDSANTLQSVAGTMVAIGIAAPEPTWPVGAFMLCVIDLNDTQTSISLATDIFDRRIIWSDENTDGGGLDLIEMRTFN